MGVTSSGSCGPSANLPFTYGRINMTFTFRISTVVEKLKAGMRANIIVFISMMENLMPMHDRGPALKVITFAKRPGAERAAAERLFHRSGLNSCESSPQTCFTRLKASMGTWMYSPLAIRIPSTCRSLPFHFPDSYFKD